MEDTALALRQVKSTILLSLLFVSVLLFSLPVPKTSNAQTPAPQPGTAAVNVVCIATTSYGLFKTGIPQPVNVTVNLYSLNLTASQQIFVLSTFRANSFAAQAIVNNGTIVTLEPIIAPGTYGAFVAYYLTLPVSTENVSVAMTGEYATSAILYRFVVNLPIILLSGIDIPTSYSISLVTTAHETIVPLLTIA